MVIVAGHTAVAPQQRESYLTVAVQEYIRRRAARVRRTLSMSCSTDRAMTDEIGAAVRSYRTTTKPTRRGLRS
jgi:hypothetical protein